MGVSGAGKSTLMAALATRLGWAHQDGDDLHPATNVEKMRRGEPLTDADRAPWLAAVGRWIDDRRAEAAALEPPQGEEDVISVDIALPTEVQVERVLEALGLRA